MFFSTNVFFDELTIPPLFYLSETRGLNKADYFDQIRRQTVTFEIIQILGSGKIVIFERIQILGSGQTVIFEKIQILGSGKIVTFEMLYTFVN